MRASIALIGLSALVACGDKDDGTTDDTGGSATDDTGEAQGLQPAALAQPSGDCPDMSSSGYKTFTSSGEDRSAYFLIPEGGTQDAPVIFFFHGLVDTEPTTYMAEALNLQAEANASGAIIVLPESRKMSFSGFEFYMWEAMEQDDLDLVLYDDLRACVVDELGGDITRLTAMGFSGGALFTTTLARERGDTFAAIAEMSGGADAEIPTFDNLAARYDTPAYTMPALLISGGSTDEWPGGGFTIINFEEATDVLQDHLVTDSHFTVRCSHTQGHTIPTRNYSDVKEWVLAHTYGEPSPYEADGIGDMKGDCEVVTEVSTEK